MKPISKVFAIIATLVAALLAWMLFFNNNGVLEQGWNTMVKPVNQTWEKISGNSDGLIPTFDDAQGGYDGNNGLIDAQDSLGE